MPIPELLTAADLLDIRGAVAGVLTDRCTIIDRLDDEEDGMGGVRPGELLIRTRNCSVTTGMQGGLMGATEQGGQGQATMSSLPITVTFEYGEIISTNSVIEVNGGYVGAKAFTVDATLNQLVFAGDHNLEQNQRVSISSPLLSGLPSPLVEREVYNANIVDSVRITLSLSEGGAVIDLTTTGMGTHYLVLRKPLEVVSVIDGQSIQASVRVICLDRGAPGEF